MSEEKTSVLAAKIINVEKKEEIATVERTMSFAKESDAEQVETKSLDDVIGEFIQQIQETCNEKKVVIQDLDNVYDQIAIGFALSAKFSDEKSSKMAIEVLVCDAEEKGVEGHD
jgi:hypothetical protein